MRESIPQAAAPGQPNRLRGKALPEICADGDTANIIQLFTGGPYRLLWEHGPIDRATILAYSSSPTDEPSHGAFAMTFPRLLTAIIICLALLLVLVAAQSLQWPIGTDSVDFMYMAYLMKSWSLLPYRDFFDINMPGVHLIHFLILSIFGDCVLGFRIADLLYLLAILTTTFMCMRYFDRQIGLFSALVFGLVYLKCGLAVSMERDYFVLLPIALAVMFSVWPLQCADAIRGALIGFMFGLASLIKVTAAVGLPVVALFVALKHDSTASLSSRLDSRAYMTMGCALLSFAAPLFITSLIMFVNGSLKEFLEISSGYWPLYLSLDASHRAFSSELHRALYVVNYFFFFGGFGSLLFAGIFGLFVVLYHSTLGVPQKRFACLLAVLTAVYAVYAALAVKSWPYHWIVFAYFSTLLSSLCILPLVRRTERSMVLFSLAVLCICLVPQIKPPTEFVRSAAGHLRPSADVHVQASPVEAVADYLRENMRDDDVVQALDWGGRTLEAMLKAKAGTATPFLYDVMFYHNISASYIRELRKRFLADLDKARPRFIIDAGKNKARVSGPDTADDFPELNKMIETSYSLAFEAGGYKVYERRQ